MVQEWVQDYYNETDRPKRKEILEKAIAEEGMTPENELRKYLYDARYGDSEEAGREVDYFIRGWMTLEYMKATSKFFLTKRKINKEIATVREDWQFAKVAEYGQAGADILYDELCNLTRLYLQICRRDKAYGSFIFGLGRVKDSTLSKRVSDDIYRMAYELPHAMDLVEEFAPFTKAATRIFCQEFPHESGKFYGRMKEDGYY
ncbi:MAG: hypothetical protein IJI10_03960 [Eubacterium sp.]|nr:hypothetical protein [Eubacterium sp.]